MSKKMKFIVFLFSFIWIVSAQAQVTLSACLEASRNHSVQRKAAQQAYAESSLTTEQKRLYKKIQVGSSYEYRFNPIIPAQLVPVGQFNPIPTSETRAIQFGAPFQQSLGISAFQPLIQVQDKLAVQESEWKEASARFDLLQSQSDQDWEVVRTYAQLQFVQAQQKEAVQDTLRSFLSFQTVQARFKEGKVLKTDWNQSVLQHRANLLAWQKLGAAIRSEQIYLAYLTGWDWEDLRDQTLSTSFEWNALSPTILPADSLISYQKLGIEEELIQLSRQKDKALWVPSVGLQGYLGANQFSQTGNPFLANSWFGNSFIGLQVQIPLQAFGKNELKEKKWRVQQDLIQSKKQILIQDQQRDFQKVQNELSRIQAEMNWQTENLHLWTENVQIYQKRLSEGQVTPKDLILAETELQKNRDRLITLRQEWFLTWIQFNRLYGKLDQVMLKN